MNPTSDRNTDHGTLYHPGENGEIHRWIYRGVRIESRGTVHIYECPICSERLEIGPVSITPRDED